MCSSPSIVSVNESAIAALEQTLTDDIRIAFFKPPKSEKGDKKGGEGSLSSSLETRSRDTDQLSGAGSSVASLDDLKLDIGSDGDGDDDDDGKESKSPKGEKKPKKLKPKFGWWCVLNASACRGELVVLIVLRLRLAGCTPRSCKSSSSRECPSPSRV